MPTSIAFYCDILGFAIESQSGPGPNFGWALLTRPGAELMLNTAFEDDERPQAPDPARASGHGDTCLYFGCRDLDAAYEHLRANGVKAHPPKITNYGMRQLYFNDPDGFGLCLQWPANQSQHDQWVERYDIEPVAVTEGAVTAAKV